MNVRALVIDEAARNAIRQMVIYAEDHPYTMDDLLDLMNGNGIIPGDTKEHVCFLDVGYRVVYSVEQQPVGDCRHVSISVDTDGKMPSPEAVNVIIELLGFKHKVGSKDLVVNVEKVSPKRNAVSILEVIK